MPLHVAATLRTSILAVLAVVTVAACQPPGVGQSTAATEGSDDPSTPGAGCVAQDSAASDGPVTVIIAARRSPSLAATIDTAVAHGGRVILAAYGQDPSRIEVVHDLDLTGQGPNNRYREADAARRRACLSTSVDRMPPDNRESGAALSAIRTAAAHGARAGSPVTVVVHDAGTARESGVDLAEADLSDPDVVSTFAGDLVRTGIVGVDPVIPVTLFFVAVGEDAPNSLVAAHRRALFTNLCQQLAPQVEDCTVAEVYR